MPVVFGVGRGFGFFTSTGQQVGNFIRRIVYPYAGNHYPTDVFFSSDEKIYITGVGENDTQSYGILTKRDALASVYNKEILTTNGNTFDAGYNGIDISSAGNIYAAGFTYASASDVYPVITKFDANGNIIWNRYHSSTSGKICTNVNVSANGNIYICGGDYAPTGAVEGNFVAAYNADGTCLWNKYITDSSGTYTNFSFVDIKSMSDNSIIVVGYFTGNKKKSIITKYDSSGNLIWNKTLQLSGSYNTFINQVHIDSSNQIYMVGETSEISTPYNSRSFVIKFTKEGNLVWQYQSPVSSTEYFSNTGIAVDDEVGAVYTIGVYKTTPSSNKRLCITKYDANGLQIFRRILRSNIADPANDINYPNVFATNTDLYISFVDEASNNSICYGRASISGNGVGSFEYPDGTGRTFYYTTLSTTDVLGTLFDGSVMNLSSDFITYPFSATKIMFDDLAGVYSDKRIVAETAQEITSSSYSTTNAYALLSSDKIVYGSNLLLNYDFANKASYPGTGSSVNNLSSVSFPGTVDGATFNSAGYFIFDATNDAIDVSNSSSLTFTNQITVSIWVSSTNTSGYRSPIMKTTNSSWADGFGMHQYEQNFTWWVNGWNGSHVVVLPKSSFTLTNFIGTYDGSNLKLYENGSLVQTGTSYTANITNPNVNIQIGKGTPNYYWGGNIGEVQLYNTALSAAQVSQNFNATRAKYGV